MIRIAITGPESSGKTTLAKALSDYFESDLVKEYAREYLEKLDRDYGQSDLTQIAKGHWESIQLSQNSIQIVDSDFIVVSIWSKYRFGNVEKEIADFVSKKVFDLHILCSPDIPWEADPLRENPENRDELFRMYKMALDQNQKQYIIVEGKKEDRLKKSIEEIESLLN